MCQVSLKVNYKTQTQHKLGTLINLAGLRLVVCQLLAQADIVWADFLYVQVPNPNLG